MNDKDQEKINQAIGELITRDKYMFVDTNLITNIVRDYVGIVGIQTVEECPDCGAIFEPVHCAEMKGAKS